MNVTLNVPQALALVVTRMCPARSGSTKPRDPMFPDVTQNAPRTCVPCDPGVVRTPGTRTPGAAKPGLPRARAHERAWSRPERAASLRARGNACVAGAPLATGPLRFSSPLDRCGQLSGLIVRCRFGQPFDTPVGSRCAYSVRTGAAAHGDSSCRRRACEDRDSFDRAERARQQRESAHTQNQSVTHDGRRALVRSRDNLACALGASTGYFLSRGASGPRGLAP